MAPLVGTVIDPAALAKHVLTAGFGIKDPDKFMMQQQPQQAPGQGAPPGAQPGAGPGAGQMPPGMPISPQPEGAFSPTGGVPPELLAQIQGQMDVDLPFS